MENHKEMKYSIAILFFFIQLFVLNAQSTVYEAEVKNYIKAAKTLSNVKIDSALLLANKALEIIEEQELNHYKFDVYDVFQYIYMTNSEFEKSDSMGNLALEYATDSLQKADIYIRKFELLHRTKGIENEDYLTKIRVLIANDTLSPQMARYYMCTYATQRSTDQIAALNSLLRARDIAEKLEDRKQVMMIDYNLSIVFTDLKDYERIIEVLGKVREESTAIKLNRLRLFSLYGLINAYRNLDRKEDARKLCYEAIELKKKHGMSIAFGFIYNMLSDISLQTNQIDSAIYYCQQAIDFSKSQNDIQELTNGYSSMALIYYKQGDFNKTLYYGELAYALEVQDMPHKVSTALAEIYAARGKYKKAYQFLAKNNELWTEKDTSNVTYKLTTALLNDKFEQEKQQLALEKALQAKALEAEQTKSKALTFGLIAALLLFLGAVYSSIVIRRNRKIIQKQKEELEEKSNYLETLNALKDKTFAIISHDLRGPINNLRMALDLALNAKLSQTDFLRMAKNFHQNTTAVYETLNNLLHWANLQLQARQLPASKLTLKEEVAEVAAFLNGLLQHKELHFSNKIDEELQVYANSNHINLVVRNLISNAIKFTPKGGQIEVEATAEEHEIVVSVKDSGIGIVKEKLTELFEGGFSTSGTKGESGTGLGLSLCKEIIERNGGQIGVESQVGQGTRFFFSLPKLAV